MVAMQSYKQRNQELLTGPKAQSQKSSTQSARRKSRGCTKPHAFTFDIYIPSRTGRSRAHAPELHLGCCCARGSVSSRRLIYDESIGREIMHRSRGAPSLLARSALFFFSSSTPQRARSERICSARLRNKVRVRIGSLFEALPVCMHAITRTAHAHTHTRTRGERREPAGVICYFHLA